MTPGQRGREIGRAMIAVAILAIGVTVFLFLAAPGGTSPMFDTPPGILGLPVSLVLGSVGVGGVIFGLVWMIRIYRADPEPDQHAWRYRRDRWRSAALAALAAHRAMQMAGRGPGLTRGQRGRLIARMMFVTTIVGIVLIGIVALADPGHIGPMFADPGPPSPDWGVLILALGFIGVAVGTIWMYRIARDDPEPDQHAWRYRRDR